MPSLAYCRTTVFGSLPGLSPTYLKSGCACSKSFRVFPSRAKVPVAVASMTTRIICFISAAWSHTSGFWTCGVARSCLGFACLNLIGGWNRCPTRFGQRATSKIWLCRHGNARERYGGFFHGRFLRPENFGLQNSAILRQPVRKLNYRITESHNGAQAGENKRKMLPLNYKSAALPAELCGRECRAH